ncbi:MAG: hypothetical protein ACREM3_01660 [Candidatus Rokuibacteriota bacterium]
MEPPRRRLPLGALLGTWIGAFGWVIGFTLVTLPDTLRFALPLAGGVLLTLVFALAGSAVAGRAQRFLPATIALGCAAIGLYWNLVMEPAVLAEPDVVARLHRIGASTEFPLLFVVIAAVLGLAMLAWAWWLPRRRVADLWDRLLDFLP